MIYGKKIVSGLTDLHSMLKIIQLTESVFGNWQLLALKPSEVVDFFFFNSISAWLRILLRIEVVLIISSNNKTPMKQIHFLTHEVPTACFIWSWDLIIIEKLKCVAWHLFIQEGEREICLYFLFNSYCLFHVTVNNWNVSTPLLSS